MWQKRRSEVRDGYLYICHSDETKPPTTFNLLTCHVKPVADDPRAFDLISCQWRGGAGEGGSGEEGGVGKSCSFCVRCMDRTGERRETA